MSDDELPLKTPETPEDEDNNLLMRLSSVISLLSKLLLISMNVGKPPVVRPLIRCIVVVGASA